VQTTEDIAELEHVRAHIVAQEARIAEQLRLGKPAMVQRSRRMLAMMRATEAELLERLGGEPEIRQVA
jgi:hypothetical protein